MNRKIAVPEPPPARPPEETEKPASGGGGRGWLALVVGATAFMIVVGALAGGQLAFRKELTPVEFWDALRSGRIEKIEMTGADSLVGVIVEPEGKKRFEAEFPSGYLVERFDEIRSRLAAARDVQSETVFVERLRSGAIDLRTLTHVRRGGEAALEAEILDEDGAPRIVDVKPDAGALRVKDIAEAVRELESSRGFPVPRETLFVGDPKGFEYSDGNRFLTDVLLTFGPWVLILGFFWFFLGKHLRAPGSPGGVLAFGRSRARLHDKGKGRVTFDDVAGISDAKEEVREIIEFLRNPARFSRVGARIPRGVLLSGHPGTGKTLLAKAIAGEANVPFFTICGSDFVEMFVGVGASRVRDLFQKAKENSPCIVFLDEIDAVGRRRGTGLGGGHDEREQTLNAILVEMDGFDSDQGIILIAATNRPDVLDPALLRPGRFDREIVIDLPDLEGRREILKVHARKVKMAAGTNLEVIARGTPTFSGAELEALVNEAALGAVMKGRGQVTLDDLEEARDKVKWGRSKSRAMDKEDQRVTAYHEAGHALAAALIEGAEPLHKVTIVPRGMALGATMQLPERDTYHMKRRKILGNVELLLSGRIAEEIFCDDVSAGAQNDIERATDLVRSMVCEWGMSERIGPISYAEPRETFFLGREVTRTKPHSEALSIEIDREVKRIIDECYEAARVRIERHAAEVSRIAEALLLHESLTGAEVDSIIAGALASDVRRPKGARPPSGEPADRPDEKEDEIGPGVLAPEVAY